MTQQKESGISIEYIKTAQTLAIFTHLLISSREEKLLTLVTKFRLPVPINRQIAQPPATNFPLATSRAEVDGWCYVLPRTAITLLRALVRGYFLPSLPGFIGARSQAAAWECQCEAPASGYSVFVGD